MTGQIVKINAINLWHEQFGNPQHPTIVLMMGNSAQGIMWTDEFCERLIAQQFHVIRFDYRDTGLSTCIDYEINPYHLVDLMEDVISLLDALKIQHAHFVGLSMGGAIALLLAVYHAERVLTITSMMSSPELSIKN